MKINDTEHKFAVRKDRGKGLMIGVSQEPGMTTWYPAGSPEIAYMEEFFIATQVLSYENVQYWNNLSAEYEAEFERLTRTGDLISFLSRLRAFAGIDPAGGMDFQVGYGNQKQQLNTVYSREFTLSGLPPVSRLN